MSPYFDGLWLVRLLFQRGLSFLYLVAFLSTLNQFPTLLGERGFLPVRHFLDRVRFRDAPSLFHWRYSDRLLRIVASTGAALSALTLLGITERMPLPAYMAVWLVMWALYLSIVNVGQTFYGFGWESMIVEAGFFAAFLGPRHYAPPVIVILIFRWMLFRVEFGAGLIKLRHDQCWRDLTCLYYHYETQPLPNATSWYFHRLPKPFHRFSVAYSHFVQVFVPIFVFAPQPVASIAAAFLISQQLLLIVSGNYSWLNWLTLVLGITAFSDSALAPVLPLAIPSTFTHSAVYDWVLYALAVGTIALSIKPLLNLFSRNQLMNYSWNRYHLVNAYGAFGSMTRQRYEIVLEGTDAPIVNAGTHWKPYEFKGKPGDPMRRPSQVAPYHLRLDWLMWFLPFSVRVLGNRVVLPGYEMWFIRFVRNLLQNEPQTLKLIRHNPFPERPPQYIRASYYLYEYTSAAEKRESGAWWKRTFVDYYLPPVSMAALDAAMG
ncbi:MAG: lipase maturation factor family protein [Acidobacteriota bacterium]|nr:lipase maturation factor family protein [Acidobacteriota bacterium]